MGDAGIDADDDIDQFAQRSGITEVLQRVAEVQDVWPCFKNLLITGTDFLLQADILEITR